MVVLQYPWDTDSVQAAPPRPESVRLQPKPRGRRPAAITRATTSETAAAPDWLYHHLTISGPAETVQSFAAAALGSGITPWQLDFAAIEEDMFIRAVSQPAARRNLTVEGCRILARQFAEKVAAHQAKAAALVGRSMACAFDLNVLLPVPADILQLGPGHPHALAWLSENWGITDRLRQVTIRKNPTIGRRLKTNHAVIGYGFFTDGATPHAAIGNFKKCWPALRFLLQPRSAD